MKRGICIWYYIYFYEINKERKPNLDSPSEEINPTTYFVSV